MRDHRQEVVCHLYPDLQHGSLFLFAEASLLADLLSIAGHCRATPPARKESSSHYEPRGCRSNLERFFRLVPKVRSVESRVQVGGEAAGGAVVLVLRSLAPSLCSSLLQEVVMGFNKGRSIGPAAQSPVKASIKWKRSRR